MANLKSVLERRTLIHKIKRIKLIRIKDINEKPDIRDPNFYCKSCEKDFYNRSMYRSHPRNAHFMVLKSTPKLKILRNGVFQANNIAVVI